LEPNFDFPKKFNKITHQKQMNDTLFIFLQMKTPYFGPFGILFPVADFKSEKKHL
jgi:hypothetical protein